jgi:hypothetical protein
MVGKGYLKTKQRHGLLLTKFLQTHNSLKNTPSQDSVSLGVCQKTEMGWENE